MAACRHPASKRDDNMNSAEQAQFGPVPSPARTEFLWRSAGPRHIHGHVARPVVVSLDQFGARSVLDLGCGNGWLTGALASCGFEVLGLDRSSSGIHIARSSHPDLPFRLADATERLDADLIGRFDAVVAVELLDHVAQPRQLLQRALTALRPGGFMLVTTPYHGYLKNLGLALSGRMDLRWQALDEHGRLKFFSRRSLVSLMQQSGVVDVRFQAIGRTPPFARSMLVSGLKPLA
jgi:2-polyprenyl-3-methyl-5-hydroxy-6-metoxy-1,4-benzoquinol methylase